MKQLSSFMVMNIDGGTRVSYTYDVIDDSTGNIVSQNNKENFFALDSSLLESIQGVQNFIRQKRLNS